jgi:hypothetical protein
MIDIILLFRTYFGGNADMRAEVHAILLESLGEEMLALLDTGRLEHAGAQHYSRLSLPNHNDPNKNSGWPGPVTRSIIIGCSHEAVTKFKKEDYVFAVGFPITGSSPRFPSSPSG